jgi:hypothetical protein
MTRALGWASLLLTGLATAWLHGFGWPLASCRRLARDAFGTVRRRYLAVPDLVAARIRRSLARRAAAVVVMIGR